VNLHPAEKQDGISSKKKSHQAALVALFF